MKTQTHISYLEDKDGKMIDFERWGYKKAKTVLNKAIEFYKEMNKVTWYKRDTLEKSYYLVIYATPDGVNKEANPIHKVPLNKFLEILK